MMAGPGKILEEPLDPSSRRTNKEAAVLLPSAAERVHVPPHLRSVTAVSGAKGGRGGA